MPIVSPAEFKSSLKQGAKLLALDISRNAIGVAFADTATQIVTPVAVIKRARLADDAAKLSGMIREYEAAGLVVGWPLNMDGTEGARCQAVKDTLAELLKNLPPIKAVFHDERQSTLQAERMVEEIGGKSRKNQGKTVDNHAALIILRDYLDTM